MNLFLRLVLLLLALAVAAVVVAAGVAATFVSKWASDIPDYRRLDSLTLGTTTRVYARDLSPLGSLTPALAGGARINRTLVTLEEISPYMIASVVTNEDRRFFEHYGLDPIGISRGLKKTLNNERVEGGSTLTNQLVKLTLLDDLGGARTPERKVKEWLLSLQVERSFTKEEILNNYLNAIYWGDGGAVELFGVHAAARAYFGKLPRDLNLAQSTYLATLVPSPRRYLDYKIQRGYMRSLLERMVEDGWVTRAQADAAWREKLQPRGWKVTYDATGNVKSAELVNRSATYLRAVTTTRAPHFMQQVEKELIARFGAERVFGSGGLNVYTTLDPQAQSAAELASRQAVVPQGATLGAVLLDPYTAEVLAMVGQKIEAGRPPPEWNNAVQGKRQVGSSIKPLLYTTALSTGLTQLHTEEDRPVSFPCSGCPDGEYKPQNFGGKFYHRDMTLREALNRSLNIPTLRLADRIGLPTFRGKLTELGFTPSRDSGLSLAIGTLETTPLMMAAAYAPFVNGGIWRQPRYISRVTTVSGQVLYDAANERQAQRRVWSPQVAYLGLDMLLGYVNDFRPTEGGFGWKARIPGWEVGGKTGTTNDVRDLWFVGATPTYVGAVWVGKQAGGTMGDKDYSGEVNPPIWRTMVMGALAGKPPRQFTVPDGIMYETAPFKRDVQIALVDPNYQGKTTVIERDNELPQLREASPPPSDATVKVNLDRRTGRLATEFTPPEFVIERRVRPEELPGYAPDPNPQPLPDDLPASLPAAAPKPPTDSPDGIPRAPQLPAQAGGNS
ncbi:transglycosylase domain-containing protein [Deinococcus peraridilitoris]|uniref:peptidoglycan glycosyltransferase n=1 Tax=Deinococcus peraridilitoris (strain DSM 19664 / LMG 22246 / CIP 109416 / KR-200) TaxID=937777 RepID=K9ZZK0_DEIPD|nr:transglycosylase domain-containing protein [Deinococcus peraridilitoris]AFZ66367.1 membrane carboxypeptidase (penicillin-binding protein) [Deinococcus peraridilitoris DSM 19664]